MSNNLYLTLFHGRTDPKASLNDWGFDGPVIGPVGFGFTYEVLKVYSPEQDDHEELNLVDGMVMLEGNYYGDFDIFHEGDIALVEMRQRNRQFMDYTTFKLANNRPPGTGP